MLESWNKCRSLRNYFIMRKQSSSIIIKKYFLTTTWICSCMYIRSFLPSFWWKIAELQWNASLLSLVENVSCMFASDTVANDKISVKLNKVIAVHSFMITMFRILCCAVYAFWKRDDGKKILCMQASNEKMERK